VLLTKVTYSAHEISRYGSKGQKRGVYLNQLFRTFATSKSSFILFMYFNIQKFLPLILSVAVAVGLMGGYRLQETLREKQAAAPTSNSRNGKIEEVLGYINAQYVENKDTKALAETAITQLMEGLDPHSVYISANEVAAKNDELDGDYVGIGVEYLIARDTPQVIIPLKEGPAALAGILAGDKLLMGNDSLLTGKNATHAKISKHLRGEVGEKVKVTILRGEEKQPRDIIITRTAIPVKSIDAAYMLNANTGYIKINRFANEASQEFTQRLMPLMEKEGMKHLVIDLRQNGGGFLPEAVSILSQIFKEKDRLLVYTEGAKQKRVEYKTTGRAMLDIDKVAVLMDENSASASEILGGAIQDWDRGSIVGRRSFGKGLVQVQYPLKDGSALRLTVARYYTPSGRCIQKAYDSKNRDKYDEDNETHRLIAGELVNKDSIHIADTTTYRTAKGNKVFGGGGITPDVFVPLDTLVRNRYFHQLMRHLPAFAVNYAIKNPQTLPSTVETFKQYTVSPAILTNFVQYAAKLGVKPNPKQWLLCQQEIARILRANFARIQLQNESFYQIWNMEDTVIKAAERAINQ
jgi:carboxyl-terminal processing protease